MKVTKAIADEILDDDNNDLRRGILKQLNEFDMIDQLKAEYVDGVYHDFIEIARISDSIKSFKRWVEARLEGYLQVREEWRV